MEKFKGTPGPWSFTVCDDGYPMVCTEGDIIAEASYLHAPREEGDTANFRLIAKAPELLGVAIKARDTFRRYEGLHLEKGTVDGHQKAAANKYMADLLDGVIRQATGGEA